MRQIGAILAISLLVGSSCSILAPSGGSPGLRVAQRPQGGGTARSIDPSSVGKGPLTGSVSNEGLSGAPTRTTTPTTLPGPTTNVTPTDKTQPTTGTVVVGAPALPTGPYKKPAYKAEPGEVVVFLPAELGEYGPTLRRLVDEGIPIPDAIAGVIANARGKSPGLTKIIDELPGLNADLAEQVSKAKQAAGNEPVKITVIQVERGQ